MKSIIRNLKKFLPSYCKNKEAGFTLVELLLYSATLSLIILAVAVLLSIMMSSRVKNEVIAEVEQQGVLVMQNITQNIRNASTLTSPTQGASAASLSLVVAGVTTVYDISAGVLRITEGGTPTNLTSSRVTVSALTFQNLSRTGTPGTIDIQYTITHINPQNKPDYQYAKTFYGTASLR